MNDYLDVIEKITFHKEKILNSFLKQGIFPNSNLIADKLNDIDMKLSLFKNYNVVSGHKFDVANFNESLKLIYEDIVILYTILNYLSVKKYNDLQIYVNSYINELSSIVSTYEKKAQYENNSTVLGETILFQDNNFTQSSDDSTTIIDLGDITVEAASEIACIANINNADLDNVLFEFNDGELTVSPYNKEYTTITIPGEKNKKEYDYSLDSDENTSDDNLIINLNEDIDIKDKYDILAGKDKMFVNNYDDNTFHLQEIPNNSGTILFNEKCSINFYILNGQEISFKFNKKPLSCNFSLEDTVITNLNPIQNFHIEFDENTSFAITLNKGCIYALKEDGIINNNKLYYSGPNIATDFHIIQTKPGDEKKYNLKMKIYNDNKNSAEIDSIVIKKLN